MNRRTVALAVALVLVAGLLWRSVGAADDYRAAFTHASGIRVGDEVRMAGIATGQVTGIELDRGRAYVSFSLDDGAVLRSDSQVRVKLASMLGQTYLEVSPGSGDELEAGATLTTGSTAPSYTVSEVVAQTDDTLAALDLDALDRAVTTVATELDQDPGAVDRAIEGATRLSNLVAEKDDQIDRLLGYTRDVTTTIRSQQDQLESLLTDADTVLALVVRRRETIRSLLDHGHQVVETLNQMAARNDATVRRLLDQLGQGLEVLQKRSDELDLTLQRMGPLGRYFANATGNGPWLEVGAPYFLLPDALWCPLVQPTGGCR